MCEAQLLGAASPLSDPMHLGGFFAAVDEGFIRKIDLKKLFRIEDFDMHMYLYNYIYVYVYKLGYVKSSWKLGICFG